MTTTFIAIGVLGLLISGCETEPERTLQTGVNEILTVSNQPISAVELNKRRHEDLEPYSGLNIQGPLPKREVIKAVQRNRKALEKCYRFVIGDSPREISGPRRTANYQSRDNQYDRSNSTMKPDGMLESTNYNTPRYEPLPTTSGEVVVNFTVGSDGKVREARSNLSDFRGSFMRTCIENAVSDFRFTPGSGESQVRYLILRFSKEIGLVSE